MSSPWLTVIQYGNHLDSIHSPRVRHRRVACAFMCSTVWHTRRRTTRAQMNRLCRPTCHPLLLVALDTLQQPVMQVHNKCMWVGLHKLP